MFLKFQKLRTTYDVRPIKKTFWARFWAGGRARSRGHPLGDPSGTPVTVWWLWETLKMDHPKIQILGTVRFS